MRKTIFVKGRLVHARRPRSGKRIKKAPTHLGVARAVHGRGRGGRRGGNKSVPPEPTTTRGWFGLMERGQPEEAAWDFAKERRERRVQKAKPVPRLAVGARIISVE